MSIDICDINSIYNEKVVINNEDFINLILLFKYKDSDYVSINLDELLKSISKYKNYSKFSNIYYNLNFINDLNGEEILDINDILDKKIKDNILFMFDKEIVITADESYYNLLKMKYRRNEYSSFDLDHLMFYINNDLKYGIDNWKLVFEDTDIKMVCSPKVINENKNVKKLVR